MTLSCVIPAYNNRFMLARSILSVLTQTRPPDELIVSDDSPGDSVQEMVDGFRQLYPALRYVPGARTGNPADNWNRALESATGKHVIMLHHDEWFATPDYLERAAAAIAAGPVGRCFFTQTSVVGGLRSSNNARALRWADKLGYPLWTLYAVNWIGPLSGFIFPAGELRFDRRLKGLIDVDFYFRAAREGGLTRLPGINVFSQIHGRQISASIDLHGVSRAELDYLGNRDGGLTTRQWRIVRTLILTRDALSRARPIVPRGSIDDLQLDT